MYILKKLWQRSFGFLQSFSKALMIPVSFIPAAALLLGLSYWLSDFTTFANYLHIGASTLLALLPLIFVGSIVYGMSKEKDGHLVIVSITSYFLITEVIKAVNSIDIYNQLSAITLGLFFVYLYNILRKIKTPGSLVFFEGRRFAAIGTLIISLLIAIPLGYIFEFLSDMLNYVGVFINSSNTFSPFIFGATSRLLIPSGLHHIWHNLFWFDTIGINAMPNYLIGLGDTKFLAGLFPIMLFGLPGAALAIMHTAKSKNKKTIAILMTSAIISSVLLGITEPIEFSFLFVSPILFIFHAVMTGLSMVLVNLLNITIGFSFSAGLLDLLIQLKNPLNNLNHILLLIPVGLGFGVTYYFFFKYIITKFNLLTPGRSHDKVKPALEGNIVANKMIQGLGGVDNIVNIDHCATRLRLVVKDSRLVDDKYLKSQGALSVLKANHNIQIVIGPEVEGIANFMKNDTNDKYRIKYMMPIKGKYEDISKTPDEVFSQGLLGPGFVIYPTSGEVLSPIDGTVTLVYPTKHAIAISNNKGIDVMIHFGLDTVELQGRGFTMNVTVGDKVKMGDLLMNVDLEFLTKNNKDLATPVVFVQEEKIHIRKQDNNNIFTIEVL